MNRLMAAGDGDLHSNMVRFIIQFGYGLLTRNEQIYIPIWLDLLWSKKIIWYMEKAYLHSNMVRFIIDWRNTI